MQFKIEDHSGTRIISVKEARIDAAVAIEFKDEMRQMIDGAPGDVVLNLNDVGFVDSSGLGAIVASMKQTGNGKKLELAGLTRNVQKVFALTRMDRVFTIHPDVTSFKSKHAKAG